MPLLVRGSMEFEWRYEKRAATAIKILLKEKGISKGLLAKNKVSRWNDQSK